MAGFDNNFGHSLGECTNGVTHNSEAEDNCSDTINVTPSRIFSFIIIYKNMDLKILTKIRQSFLCFSDFPQNFLLYLSRPE